jgi:nitroreductase
MTAAFDAVSARRSHSLVGPTAPTHEELLPLVEAAARVADHGALRPWRLLELRGAARERLGEAFAASTDTDAAASKLATKPLRAALLIAVVACTRQSDTVAEWEQDATAAGVAHTLSLLLHDAGWGVMWRTGPLTRSLPVRLMHGLSSHEKLLGWLYVGDVPADGRPGVRLAINPEDYLTAL